MATLEDDEDWWIKPDYEPTCADARKALRMLVICDCDFHSAKELGGEILWVLERLERESQKKQVP